MYELTRKALSDAGLQQKDRTLSLGSMDGSTALGSISHKLMSQWVRLCTVVERLSDVVYRVRLIKRNRMV